MHSVERIEVDGHLAPLVEQVEQGLEVVITRNGRDVARMVSVRHVDWAQRRAAIAELREFGKSRSLGGIPIRSIREDGRRY